MRLRTALILGALAGYFTPEILGINVWKLTAIVRLVVGVAVGAALALLLGPWLKLEETSRLTGWLFRRRLSG